MPTLSSEDFSDDATVVVGGGAAAAAIARVLVERGVPFVWLAGQARPTSFSPRFETMSTFRQRETNLWQELLGDDVALAELLQPSSPKNRVRRFRVDTNGYEHNARLESTQFILKGTLTQGGLTNFWGAEIHVFDEADIAMPDEVWLDLRRSYRRVAAAIPITGIAESKLRAPNFAGLISQAPLPLPKVAQRILAHYEPGSQPAPASVRIRQSWLAIRTTPSSLGGSCTRCNGCLWGCKEDAIYSAIHDIDRLSRQDSVKFEPGWIVESIQQSKGGFILSLCAQRSETVRQIRARRVFLAAGAPVSTRLALGCANLYDEWFPFGHTCGFVFAVVVPGLLGSLPAEAGHSLALLSWEVDEPDTPTRIVGSFFSPTGIPDSEVLRFFPFTRPGAIAAWKYLRGAMLIGNGFLPSDFSRTSVRLRRSDSNLEFRTQSDSSDNARKATNIVKYLSRGLLRAGAIVLPFSTKMAGPGADFHYGASLPHGGTGPTRTDMLGQLSNIERLHIADGAVLPRLPSRHPTLTIMANADRIARSVCERL